MLQKRICLAIIAALLAAPIFAEIDHKSAEIMHVRNELQQILNTNFEYKQKFNKIVSDKMLEKQTPDATLVLCSDSRVDLNAMNNTPAGRLFIVRNIGNQVKTAYGSVEYGVNHLHTEMLIIIGHSGCGAINAAMHDYSNESENIQKELRYLEVNDKASLNNNIIKNVNHQVQLAVDDFKDLVKNDKLVVIGLVYDLHNDFKHGNRKIILVNINNETNSKELENNPYVKGLDNLTILKNKN